MLVTLRHKTVHVLYLVIIIIIIKTLLSIIPPVHQHLVEDFPLEPQHPP